MNDRSRLRWLLGVTAAVVWLFAVYFYYYVVHKPFGADNVVRWLSTALDLAVWLLIVLTGAALGRRLMCIRLPKYSETSEVWVSAGVGLGMLSLAILGLGMAGLLYRWLFWLLFLALAIALRRDVRAILAALKPGPLPALDTRLNRTLAVCLGLLLAFAFVSCLTPPWAWDSQVYHLTGPKLYIQQHHIAHSVDIPYLGFPALAEMLFTAAMLLKGPVAARLIHFTFALLTLAAVFAFARRHFNGKVAWLAVTILFAVPSLALDATWAYADLALTFYTFAALYALIRWLEGRATRWLLLSAVLCGLALGTKYTAIPLPAALSLLIVWRSRERGVGHTLKALLAFNALAALLVAPWLLKNAALTGNPTYPFVFGGVFWDEFRTRWFSRWGTGLASQPWRLLAAPWEMTILGIEGGAGYSATIGPLLLTLLPMLALVWGRLERGTRRLLANLLLFCLVHYAVWLFNVARSALLVQGRLLFPIFPALAVLAAVAVDRLAALSRPQFRLQWLVEAVLVGTVALTVFTSAVNFVAANPLFYLTGYQTDRDFLSRYLGPYLPAIEHINRELPPQAKVLFLWEPRSFYCQRECWPDALLDRWLHLVYRYHDAGGIARHLREQGFTHVLFYQRGYQTILQAGFDPVTPRDQTVLANLQAGYLSPVGEWNGDYVLYELNP